MPHLSLSLLGPFVATLDDRPLIKFRTKSVQALLIYLAVESGHAHARESLMELLWPGLPLSSAQSNLRQTLYRLRSLIPEVASRDGQGSVPFLLADRQKIQANPAGVFDLDVAGFTSLIESDPGRAAALYRGDFLPDFYLPDSNPFEEWAAAKRAELRRQMLATLDALTGEALDQGQVDDAQAYAWRQLELDDLRESGLRQLMVAP